VEDRALQLFPDKSAAILVTQTVFRDQSLHGESCRRRTAGQWDFTEEETDMPKLLYAKDWIGTDTPQQDQSRHGRVIGTCADGSADSKPIARINAEA
jgi:hypothetical protein